MQPEDELPRRRRRLSGCHRRRRSPKPTPATPPTGSRHGARARRRLIGAIVGGIAWGYLVKSTKTELGIAAIGVGVLAGFGVALFAEASAACRSR